MQTARFFWSYFKRYKLQFFIIFLAVIASVAMQVLSPVYMGRAVTELTHFVQDGGADTSAFFATLHNLLLAVVLMAGASMVYSLLFTRVIANSTNEMRKGLFGKLERLTVSFLTVIKMEKSFLASRLIWTIFKMPSTNQQ